MNTLPKIAVFDFESDPFQHNRKPEPFLFGFYDGINFRSIWCDDPDQLILQVVKSLEDEPEPLLIFAHNGGRFDFHLGLIEHFAGALKIINGRIVSARIAHHELRDSFALLPFALREYRKDDIEYWKLEREHRHKYREEIVSYMRTDCVALHEIVSAFVETFGLKLTVGSAALNQLKGFHQFKTTNAHFDKSIREQYYYGGRNQCFEKGIIEAPLKIVDVNSMYPRAMRDFLHPIGNRISISDKIEPDTCFVTVEGWNKNAFPLRQDDGSLDFSAPFGTFNISIHEFNAGIETGLFRPKRIIKTYGIDERSSFDSFVSTFYETRLQAKRDGDKIKEILFKFVLNSSYGKFAQNPENFYDWRIAKLSDPPPADECPHCYGNGDCVESCYWCERLRNMRTRQSCARGHRDEKGKLKKHTPGYSCCARCDGTGFKWMRSESQGNYQIWKSRTPMHHYLNVATAASITGAARSMLLRGYAEAQRPIYCDTDSLLCEEFNGHISDTELGAWKIEAQGDLAAIGGKKLYAIFTFTFPGPNKRGEEPERVKFRGRDMWLVKKAHKGAKVTGADIISICEGKTIEYRSESPAFKLSGKTKFVERKIRMT